MQLLQGTVVRIRLLDPQGRNPKDRPCVILTPSNEIIGARSIVALAITSTFPADPSPDFYPLPFANHGRCVTGLTKRSAAALAWPPVAFKPGDVQAQLGRVPLADMLRILSQLAERGIFD